MRFDPRTVLLALCTTSVACDGVSTSEATDDFTQKTGVAALAPEIAFGETVGGHVDKKQLDLFGMDLKEGDKIKLEASIVEGDAKPDVTLFWGGHSKISSDQFTADGSKLSKSYVIEDAGTYVFAVRAFKAQASGRYTLKVTCTGGPCKGEPFVKPLEPEDAGECITLTRECAFDKLPSFDGNVGPVRARSTFEGCLGTTMLASGASCKTACDSEEGRRICDGVIDMLPFYADHLGACASELESCFDECSSDVGQGLEGGPEDQCLLSGFNGTCDSYARGHKSCGGSYADGSAEQCHALCESTFGAWNDDLDDICDMQCN